VASTLSVLFATGAAFAQTSGTGSSGTSGQRGSTSGTTGSSSTSQTSPATSATGSGYTSGRATGADADAARDINAQTRNAGSAKLGWGDRRFVTKAADSGMAELSLAQLAAQRATNSEVRSFAQKLVEDHSKVNSELMGIAGQKNVNIDKDDGKDRYYNRLSKKSGSEFDQEFVEHMIDEHEKDVRLFEKASTDAKDPEVRSFAAKHVDHLRDHLRQAQSLRQTVMPTGRMDDSSGRSTTGGTTGSGLGTSSTGSTTSGGSSSDTSGTSGTSGSSTSGTSGTRGSSSTNDQSGTGTTTPRR
jgi:putative membrane protein